LSTVLFVCKANRGRSVMSQALFERAADARHDAISAGSEAEPHGGPHPVVVQAMRELGIDLADQQPQRLTTELAARADAVVTMGCGDACPVIPGKQQRRIDWDLPDPEGRPIEDVRATRDEIARRVDDLLTELDRVRDTTSA
jgi:arsenate reductase